MAWVKWDWKSDLLHVRFVTPQQSRDKLLDIIRKRGFEPRIVFNGQ